MLTPAVVRSASGAASYYAADNYYTDGQATDASLWVGEGAAQLGLTGEVGREPFEAVLRGELPNGSTIPAGANGKHRAGMDFTFSAPKSLSLLAYVGGDARLLAAHMASVRSTVGWIERNLAETRVAKDGAQETVRSANLVVALFQHDTSRALDPQAHIHAIIANATRGPDGKWRAVHNDALWKGYSTAASVYNADLRQRVEALGYSTERVAKHGQFEISGIPREVIERFSTRSAEIDAAMKGMKHQTPEARSAVTLGTRAAKPAEIDRAELRGEWVARAEKAGIDLPAMVAEASRIAARSPTAWRRFVDGARGVGAQGLALAERLGIRVKAPDPLVPERTGRLYPTAFAAAHAVASAVRHLAEREAAFPAREVLKTALDMGAPVDAAAVEQRMATLVGRGLLIAGADGRMMTTAAALATEQAIVNGVVSGKGAVAPVLEQTQAKERVAAAAWADGRRLNAGQMTAATRILSSADRIVAVQGVAGAGKSSMLKPALAIAAEEGRAVLGLAVQNTVARRLGQDTGVEARTVASFLNEHDGRDRIDRQERRSAAVLRGAVVVIDEASMLGNDAMRRLVDVANRYELGRLVLVGDSRQLGAVEAGRPFDIVQRAGDTAFMPTNLRAANDEMRAIHAAAQAGCVGELMALLKADTVEAPGKGAETVAQMWMALSPDERERTGIYTSGRQLRADVNSEVQRLRIANGELGKTPARLSVYDPVHLSREEERMAHHYTPGRIVEFAKDLPSQGIERGLALVARSERGVVTLQRRSGVKQCFRPSKLAPNRVDDAVRVYELRKLTLFGGDQLRWTGTDHSRGLVNADTATLREVRPDALLIETSRGDRIELAPKDSMLRRIDLAYATSAHAAQGATSDRGIIAADSREGRLITTSLMRVLATRVRDSVTLVVDDAVRLERVAGRRDGAKTEASIIGKATARGDRVPEKQIALELTGRVRERSIELEM